MDAAPYRQACDRCHRQKLRCIRDSDYSGGACIRCFKAQVRCVSSPSLRLRRGEARNSQSGSRKETVRKATPEPDSEECLPNSVILDDSAIQNQYDDIFNQDPTAQLVPDIDVSLFNFSWPSNIPTEELSSSGTTTALRGPDDSGIHFGNNVGQNHIYPSSSSSIKEKSANSNETWIRNLTQINVDLYLQLSVLEQSLTTQREIDVDKGSPSAILAGTNQFCIGNTFNLMHRLLQLLDQASSDMLAKLDRGSILLVLSCYHRVVEIYTKFFLSSNLENASPPELSTDIKHSPFLIGQFELYINSPLYTPLVVSLADFMLLKCHDAVNKISGGTPIPSVPLLGEARRDNNRTGKPSQNIIEGSDITVSVNEKI